MLNVTPAKPANVWEDESVPLEHRFNALVAAYKDDMARADVALRMLVDLKFKTPDDIKQWIESYKKGKT